MSSAIQKQVITSAGQQLVFTCPPDQVANPQGMVIFNKSPYELMFLDRLVPAWCIMPFDVSALLAGSPNVIITTELADGTAVGGASTIYVQWFESVDEMPDQQAFIADAIAAALNPSTQISFTTTPAGSDFEIDFTQTGRLLGFIGSLNTSAAAGNRIVVFQLVAPGAGSPFAWVGDTPVVQPPSNDWNYEGMPGCEWLQQNTAAIPTNTVPLTAGIVVGPGWKLRARTTNLDAADRWSYVQAVLG